MQKQFKTQLKEFRQSLILQALEAVKQQFSDCTSSKEFNHKAAFELIKWGLPRREITKLLKISPRIFTRFRQSLNIDTERSES